MAQRPARDRRWWLPIALIFAAQFLSGAISSPQRSLFPVYLERDLLLSAFVISLLSSSRQVLGMVASIVGGALSDALGHRRTFVLGLSGIVAGSLIFVLRMPWLVIVIWAYVGFALGLRTVGGQGYLIAVASPERLGMLSALYTWGMTLGGALGNLVAGPVVEHIGFTGFGLWALAVSAVVVMGIGLALPQPRLAQDRDRPRRQGSGGLGGYGDLMRRPVIQLLGALRFLPTCYWGVAGIFIPLWIYDVTESVLMVAWYGTVSQVVASLAQWVVGRLSDRFGRRGPTLTALAALAASIVGLGALGGSVWSLFAFGTMAASAAWSLSALMPGLVSDVAEKGSRGRVLGFLHLLWNAGSLVGALIGGALFDTDPRWPFLIAGVLNLGAAILGIRFFQVARRASKGSASNEALA